MALGGILLIGDAGYAFWYVRIILVVSDQWQLVGLSYGRAGARILCD
jgi:hypothetical protein